jgi:hypothetical protein
MMKSDENDIVEELPKIYNLEVFNLVVELLVF